MIIEDKLSLSEDIGQVLKNQADGQPSYESQLIFLIQKGSNNDSEILYYITTSVTGF